MKSWFLVLLCAPVVGCSLDIAQRQCFTAEECPQPGQICAAGACVSNEPAPDAEIDADLTDAAVDAAPIDAAPVDAAPTDTDTGPDAELDAELDAAILDAELDAAIPDAEVLVDAGPGSVTWMPIPGGRFQMGSAEGGQSEQPIHWVTVPAFELAQTEVTVADYRACVTAGVCTTPTHYRDDEFCNWGQVDRDEHPINCVNWFQATAFAEWVSGRLPTEAEWEYAARSGGLAQRYPWGDEVATCEYAMMARVDGAMGCGEQRTAPTCGHPSGTTAHGVCDMAGNVLEWLGDEYCPYEIEREDVGPIVCGEVQRSMRGGSFIGNADDVRAANRGLSPPDQAGPLDGIRVARSADLQ